MIRHYLEWSDEGRSAIWRQLVAVVLGFAVWVIGSAPVVALLGGLLDDPRTAAAAFEYTFVVGFLAVPLIVWLLLRRPAWSVALASWPPRLGDYGLGIAIGWAVMSVMYATLLAPAGRLTYRGWGAELAGGAPLLLATVLGFAIQTGFEELYFRGLLMQATHRVTKWAPAVIGVQALFFAQLHAGNVEAWGHGTLAMAPYFLAAVTFAWAAWRTGSLVMPMGLHFANNAFLVLFVNTRGDVIQSAAPFVAETPDPAHAVAFALGQAILTIAAVEIVTRKRSPRAPAGGSGRVGQEGELS